MPRSASAGGSSRSATRLSAPSASPAASARAEAAIRESMDARLTGRADTGRIARRPCPARNSRDEVSTNAGRAKLYAARDLDRARAPPMNDGMEGTQRSRRSRSRHAPVRRFALPCRSAPRLCRRRPRREPRTGAPRLRADGLRGRRPRHQPRPAAAAAARGRRAARQARRTRALDAPTSSATTTSNPNSRARRSRAWRISRRRWRCRPRPPSKLHREGFLEVWLFQNDGRFALKTLALPQRGL